MKNKKEKEHLRKTGGKDLLFMSERGHAIPKTE